MGGSLSRNDLFDLFAIFQFIVRQNVVYLYVVVRGVRLHSNAF